MLASTPPQDVMNGYKWELYDLTKDWTQNNDIAASNPDKLKELQQLFTMEAAKYQVFPLDNSLTTRMVTPRPSVTAVRTTFTYSGELTGVPPGDAPQLLATSYTITAEVEVPEGGGDGMIVTQGGRFGGWGFYLLKGKPVYV
jgi:arylsulfatase